MMLAPMALLLVALHYLDSSVEEQRTSGGNQFNFGFCCESLHYYFYFVCDSLYVSRVGHIICSSHSRYSLVGCALFALQT